MTSDIDDARSEAVYASVAWEDGGRPDWWLNLALLWEFTLPNGRRFATSNLDEAAQRLAERLRCPRGALQRALFLQVSLGVGETVTLDNGTNVTTHRRHRFLRSQTDDLARLETFLAQFRREVVEDVLTTFANAQEEDGAAADRLLDSNDPNFYLGVSLPQLKRWAVEFEAFEVQEFLRLLSRRPKPRQLPSHERTDDSHTKLLKRHAARIREFSHYFDAADFEPRNEEESHALELHQAMRNATTARAEERATVERDIYLINFVFGKK